MLTEEKLREQDEQPRLKKFNMQANEEGFSVEAAFDHASGAHSYLAALAAEVLSDPAHPNYFVADVTHTTEGRFTVSVQRWGGKNIQQGLMEEIARLKAQGQAAEAAGFERGVTESLEAARRVIESGAMHSPILNAMDGAILCEEEILALIPKGKDTEDAK